MQSMNKYNPKHIEAKWQKYWEDNKTFQTRDDKKLPKYYVLDMFPYPSGSGLHVGHPEGYTATDIIARYQRMKGFNVLHPMGWDAFGLPAERAAVRENRHPAEITDENIDNFRGQIKRLGLSYDWDRTVNTSTPDYYRWTQWIFLKLYEKNLAYLAEVPVNWCPAQGTVLANEEVHDGKYVETGEPVERRMMRQWMLRITSYAERLLDDLNGLDWPSGIIEMQRQWIGRSEGARISFNVISSNHKIDVFTTRPETIYGASFLAVAPEHPILSMITTPEQMQAVNTYHKSLGFSKDRDREATPRDKTGVFTGAYVENPLSGNPIPVWVADYVRMDYGTGAIMAVPAHDENDNDFASRYSLPVIPVIKGNSTLGKFSHEEGEIINSGHLNGNNSNHAKSMMIDWIETHQIGKREVNYKLRDWLFSRQRYWGEPFPILHGDRGEIIPIPEGELPITLPLLTEFKPTEDGQPPLARASDWAKVELDGKTFLRETNTMPQWAGSCWYYLRYMDPHNENLPFDSEAEKYWGPVDLYVGGVEHAVLHLLYARFWHKVLYDCGLVHTKEPFKKLYNQGMILGVSYKDKSGKFYSPNEVECRNGTYFVKGTDTELDSREEKMSKSRRNVVNPDDVIAEYGADALRLYEMFMGPLDAVKPWQTNGVRGVYHFLDRVWTLFIDSHTGQLQQNVCDIPEDKIDEELQRGLNKTIKRVTEDIEQLKFNTAIARMMEFVNLAKKESVIPKLVADKFVKVLSPFAPHIAEELWSRLGHNDGISYTSWPEVDARLQPSENSEIGIYINGKRRFGIELPKNAGEQQITDTLMGNPEYRKTFDGKEVKRVIFKPNQLVNYILG